ncbi:hypothetical protein [Flavivirga spongiicola]|uniref:Uncharacterized protein n=1 Tax=Flavivirga spongiicola TaxID=421621 RepID=A0ABU7XR27_9FLAO|nr:hypothetical protein [Flavivirga sp. MEBiC05379]MDO5978218.1 hypothetical protein [Flavivirga sp. MEBiC05379]
MSFIFSPSVDQLCNSKKYQIKILAYWMATVCLQIIDLFVKLSKHELEVNALGFVGERQMFEDVVKKEMLFEHSQKKTNSQVG